MGSSTDSLLFTNLDTQQWVGTNLVEAYDREERQFTVNTKYTPDGEIRGTPFDSFELQRDQISKCHRLCTYIQHQAREKELQPVELQALIGSWASLQDPQQEHVWGFILLRNVDNNKVRQHLVDLGGLAFPNLHAIWIYWSGHCSRSFREDKSYLQVIEGGTAKPYPTSEFKHTCRRVKAGHQDSTVIVWMNACYIDATLRGSPSLVGNDLVVDGTPGVDTTFVLPSWLKRRSTTKDNCQLGEPRVEGSPCTPHSSSLMDSCSSDNNIKGDDIVVITSCASKQTSFSWMFPLTIHHVLFHSPHAALGWTTKEFFSILYTLVERWSVIETARWQTPQLQARHLQRKLFNASTHHQTQTEPTTTTNWSPVQYLLLPPTFVQWGNTQDISKLRLVSGGVHDIPRGCTMRWWLNNCEGVGTADIISGISQSLFCLRSTKSDIPEPKTSNEIDGLGFCEILDKYIHIAVPPAWHIFDIPGVHVSRDDHREQYPSHIFCEFKIQFESNSDGSSHWRAIQENVPPKHNKIEIQPQQTQQELAQQLVYWSHFVMHKYLHKINSGGKFKGLTPMKTDLPDERYNIKDLIICVHGKEIPYDDSEVYISSDAAELNIMLDQENLCNYLLVFCRNGDILLVDHPYYQPLSVEVGLCLNEGGAGEKDEQKREIDFLRIVVSKYHLSWLNTLQTQNHREILVEVDNTSDSNDFLVTPTSPVWNCAPTDTQEFSETETKNQPDVTRNYTSFYDIHVTDETTPDNSPDNDGWDVIGLTAVSRFQTAISRDDIFHCLEEKRLSIYGGQAYWDIDPKEGASEITPNKYNVWSVQLYVKPQFKHSRWWEEGVGDVTFLPGGV